MLPMNLNNFLLGSRDSGYSLSDGVAEIIDNSIQANCSYVDIQTISNKKKVEAILFADNGKGMDFETIFNYLVIGQSSTFLATSGIGKYGVGAKLSAYNIGLRIDVWSRPEGSKEYMHTYYDLDEVAKSDSVVEIREPEYSELPPEVSAMMPSDANTIVRWSKLDKFPKKSFNSIKSELTTNLGRIFRTYIYHGLKLTFNGSEIKAFDPSMQLKGTYNDEILTKAYDGEDAKIRHFEPTFICQNEVLMERDGDVATLTVTVMPKEVTRKPGMGGDSLARALKLKSNQGNVSFVRSHREVGYALIPNLFGRAVVAEDRFLAVSVEFSPKFDKDFDVRIIKRGVEPQGSLRDILQEKLKAYIPIASKVLRQQWNSQEMDVDFEAIEQAVERMNILIAKSPEATKDASPVMVAQKQLELMKLASEIGLDHDASQNYLERKCSRPFVLERVKSLGANGSDFLDFTFNQDQVIIRVNESHNVYKKVWAPLHEISKLSKDELELVNPGETAKHSLEALNLMLIAFGRQQALLPVQNFNSSMSGWSEQLDRLIYQVAKSS
ncbi:ATP-binding protein [Vibrio jasicida]|uniref:ATP-binding protein n=1 Tax=Vibrio jasicida TaxID=766224 RepID=A0AAU9QVE1_9VIBR|nr:ATP-binding protein [Vibrio jasicida]CAH1600005.1 ATP-binding protein [Vibrio jasicida]